MHIQGRKEIKRIKKEIEREKSRHKGFDEASEKNERILQESLRTALYEHMRPTNKKTGSFANDSRGEMQAECQRYKDRRRGYNARRGKRVVTIMVIMLGGVRVVIIIRIKMFEYRCG